MKLMKYFKIYLTFFVLIIFTSMVDAQATTAYDSQMLIDKKQVPAKEVTVDGSPDLVIRNFRNYLSKPYKVKSKTKNNSIDVKGITLPGLIDKKGDLTVTAEAVNDKTLIKAAYALGYDIYVNSENYKTEFDQLGKLLTGFAVRHQVNLLEAQLKTQKGFLKAKNSEISDEQRALKGYEKQKKSLNKNPETDKSQIGLVDQKIKTSKEIIKNGKDAASEYQSVIKSLEKQIKDLKAAF